MATLTKKITAESQEEFRVLEGSMKEFLEAYTIDTDGTIGVKKGIELEDGLEARIDISPFYRASEIRAVTSTSKDVSPKGTLMFSTPVNAYIKLGNKAFDIFYKFKE